MSEKTRELPESALTAKIEAALYAAGRPLDPEQLARAAGISSQRRAILVARAVAKLLNESMRAVEVVEYPGPRFAMQLKADFGSLARKFATRPLLSKGSLRTLSFIAFFQPIAGSELALRRTTNVYAHLKELEEVGFVLGERSGRTRVYKTTSRFAEYFGLDTDVKLMKKQLERRTLTFR